jgi:hypothetical protein
VSKKPKPARKRTNNEVSWLGHQYGVRASRDNGRPELVRFVCVASSRRADKYAFAAFDLIDAKGVRRRFVATPSGIKEEPNGKA